MKVRGRDESRPCNDEFIRIAERSTTLDERLTGPFVPWPEQTDGEVVRFRINKWKEACANGDDHLFDERLTIDGIDTDTAHRIVGAVRLQDSENLPHWVFTLKELIDSAEFVDPGKHGKRQSFEEVLLPFVRLARRKLQDLANKYLHLFSPAAIETLERTLLLKLSRVCSRPLVLELNVARLLGRLKGHTANDRYYDFLRTKIATPRGMLAFFSEYPVAGRLVATQVDQWIDSTAEFLSRLHNDLPEITAHFAAGEHPGIVISIVDHLSDSHCGGRTSKELTFASGLKLIYKPKDLSIDSAFQNLLEWINTRKKMLPLKTFSLLNRRTHGWVEFLTPQPAGDLQQIRNYFHRCGLLLGLLHALGATDCHSENIFACGEYPVLIDLETLLEVHPEPELGRHPNADELAQAMVRMSLLHTGMLPRWTFGDPGTDGADFSGLMGGTAQQLPYRSFGWADPETDRMRVESKYITVKTTQNRPMLNNQEPSAAQYQAAIEKGFQEMSEFLLESGDSLRVNGLLDLLAEVEVRYLNRATAEYALMLQRSLDPGFLKDGIDRSIYLDTLWRNVFLQNKESLSTLVKPERQALERLDIPYFTAEAKGSSLISDRKNAVSDLSLVPVKELLFERFAALDVEAMKRQILFLRAGISMRTGASIPRRSDPTSEKDQPALLKKSDLVQAAGRIGEILKSSAIRSKDGTITWMGAEYAAHLNQFSITPVGNTFYSGKTGIALFLAALDRFIPDQGYASMSLAALQTLRETYRGEKAPLHARSMQLGAMTGVGSICWPLLRIGELLRDHELIKDAAKVGSLITRDLIAKDRHLDMIAGSAGAAVSLLALHRSFPAGGFLDCADECGKHLLKQSTQNAVTRTWPTLRGELLTGFSHGASGHAFALCRLFEATRNEEYREAARQAFAYERSVFSQIHRNWPDFRTDTGNGTTLRFMTGWCHGAPGIVLARIGCLAQIDDPEIKDEIEIGLDTTLRAGLKQQDDICCGNFSRIEILLIASKQLKRPDLHQVALSLASALLQRASQTGVFRVDPEIRDGFGNPGFMKGIAGIGYALLRLADEGNSLSSPLLIL